MIKRSAGKSLSIALASMLMLSGASIVSAQGTMSKDSKTTTDSAGPSASDQLKLTGPQQMKLRNEISRHATKQKAPSGFNLAVGASVPSRVTLRSLPEGATAEVPEAEPYHYALVDNQILLVDPSDKRIVGIIRR
jgi:hypothetical protein